MSINISEQKLKLMLVSPFPPPAGGIATWSKLYSESKFAQNNEIEVVNTAKRSKGSGYLIDKINIPEEILRTLAIYKNITNINLKNYFDVVHFNLTCSKLGMIRDLFFIKIVKYRTNKLIIHFHCDIKDAVNSKISEHLFYKLCILSDEILCLNNSSHEHIKKITNKDSFIVPNFIESQFIISAVDKKISEQIRTIIYVGHVISSKGCKEILSVAEKLPNITFKLIGKISEEYKKMIIPQNVRLLGENSREKVIEEMLLSDLMLFPTHTEGFPIVMLEAMSCGLPIISTPVGAIPEIIENSGGILVNIGDVEEIVRAIQELQDVEKRREISNWNINKVISSYTVDIVMDKLTKIYKGEKI